MPIPVGSVLPFDRRDCGARMLAGARPRKRAKIDFKLNPH
jgi:hypothetical protein